MELSRDKYSRESQNVKIERDLLGQEKVSNFLKLVSGLGLKGTQVKVPLPSIPNYLHFHILLWGPWRYPLLPVGKLRSQTGRDVCQPHSRRGAGCPPPGPASHVLLLRPCASMEPTVGISHPIRNIPVCERQPPSPSLPPTPWQPQVCSLCL